MEVWAGIINHGLEKSPDVDYTVSDSVTDTGETSESASILNNTLDSSFNTQNSSMDQNHNSNGLGEYWQSG